MNQEITRSQCVNLLTSKRGNERYREWAELAVDRFLARDKTNTPDRLLDLLAQNRIKLTMHGEDFFTPQQMNL